MKAAIVVEAGKTPIYGDFQEPVPAKGEVQVTVSAAALSNVVKSRASGTHYSSSGQLPFVVGIDGVGRLDDGRRVYFVLPQSAVWKHGGEDGRSALSMCFAAGRSGRCDRRRHRQSRHVVMGCAQRTRQARGQEKRVLVNGATGTAGRLAVQIAKYMGARKVVATGRNAEALKALSRLGADVTIPLGDGGDAFEDALKEQFGGDGIDVVLDYLWGQSAERIIIAGAKAGKDAVPIRFVHIGSVSAPNITPSQRGPSFFGDHAHGQRHRQHPGGPPGEINRRIDAGNGTRRLRNRHPDLSALRS